MDLARFQQALREHPEHVLLEVRTPAEFSSGLLNGHVLDLRLFPTVDNAIGWLGVIGNDLVNLLIQNGSSDNATFVGGAGDDTIFAGGGDDWIDGGDGDDVVHANQGNDTCLGGDGNDVIYGHTGMIN